MQITMNDPASKVKFIREYAINASPKILFPYISTASGLSRWFADNVIAFGNNVYNVIWDKEDHFAELTNLRNNRSARLVFLDAEKQPVEDADFVDFTIETSELTGEQFLRITDYTADQDEEELEELWENLVQSLREIIGG